MRIAILSWRDLEHPEAGGAEVFAERTAATMAERGHDVVLFASSFPGGSPRTERHGFRIVRAGGRFTVYPRGLWHVWRLRRDYDIVIDVQNGVPFWTPLVFSKPLLAVVHHVHREQWFTFFPRPISSVGWFLESHVAPFVYRRQQYVTVSEASRRELAAVGVDPARVSVVYSGNEAPDHVLEEEPEPERGTRLACLGRLVPHKRVELAIDTVAALAGVYPDIALDVIGGGDWMDSLVEHARRAGVSDRVVFHGHVSDDEKHALLAGAAALAMPSIKEGWGLTILEAGYHAVPTVAFRYAGGTQESVQDGHTGLLVDTDEEFIAGLGRLLADPDERAKLGAAAREFALRFDWDRTGHELTDLVERVARP
ncbi:glycosyltransferase family 4 protein [Aeromicrobium choanae]|uniref:Glycosyltransferase involved in cell wall bisynthesis n=1 Tax=Aeromicrobium choanae TaxID=1736691 RepID=A0A1T4YMR2_9ACTN|nr:glycosyltransferase family 4 protein [Aeromicrobium choanae]SKB03089.1 Glycosyltransferase involved in cell wall bisynthesis [Aeromicrobium choanae]